MKRSVVFLAWLVGMIALPSLALAATVSYTDAARQLAGACGADINAQCKGISPGGDRIQSCLRQNAAKVSPACAKAYGLIFEEIAARSAAQAAMPHVCRWDIKRLCSNYRALGGGYLRCLTLSSNTGEVTKKCNEAINNAGWR